MKHLITNKLIIVFLLVTVLLIASCSISFSEKVDYKSLTFEELLAEKQAIDYEYYSRDQAEAKVLSCGVYVVGKDFPAGTYYFRVAESDKSRNKSEYAVYPSVDNYNNHVTKGAFSGRLFYGTVFSYSFNEGNVFEITKMPLLFGMNKSSVDNFPQYELPEGTRVHPGVYIVGEDLPAGKYTVFPTSYKSAYFGIYYDKEWSKSKYVDADEAYRIIVDDANEGFIVSLENDNAIEIEDEDVIMRKLKNEPLVFD